MLAVSACLFYVFVYTLWLKRTSTSNIVIGGAAGAAPVLIGWSAVTNSLAWAPLVLFAVIFFWTPPHFWALAIKYKDDYAAADVPMLPVVASLRSTSIRILAYTVVVWALTLVFAPVADMGAIYWVAAVVLGARVHWPSRCGSYRTRPRSGPCACSAARSPTSRCCSAAWRSTSWCATGCEPRLVRRFSIGPTALCRVRSRMRVPSVGDAQMPWSGPASRRLECGRFTRSQLTWR